MQKRIAGSVFLSSLLLISAARAADTVAPKPSVRLGDPWSIALSLEGTVAPATPRPDAPHAGSDIALRPQLDMFVARRFSVGASLPIGYHVPTGEAAPSPFLAAAMPVLRAGVLFEISDRVRVWPGVQLGCGDGPFAPRCDGVEQLWTGVDARIAVEILPRLYASAAPIARVFFSKDASEHGTIGPVFLGSNLAVGGVF